MGSNRVWLALVLAPLGCGARTGLESTLNPDGGLTRDAGCTICSDASNPNDFALHFSGDEFLLVEDVPALHLPELTVEVWCRFDATPGEYNAIVAKPVGSATDDSFAVWYQQGALRAGVDATSPTGALEYPWAPDGRWHFIAYSFSTLSGGQALYFDGVAVAASPASSKPTYDTQGLRIGGDTTGGSVSGSFAGVIDEARIWGVSRSATEVAADMKLRAGGAVPGLVAYWPFDEGNGQIAHDRAGAHNGQLGSLPATDAYDPGWVLSTIPSP